MLAELGAVVRRAGAEILRWREQGGSGGRFEGTQFKSPADLVADKYLRAELLKLLDVPVVSEEDAATHVATRPARYWLIDPIDGTASFAHGFAGFVCQVALIESGEPQRAAVYAPALEQLYLAARGQGATLNGSVITVQARARSELVLVDNYPEPRGVAARLYSDLRCARYRESGSIGLKVCLIADGTADVFVKDVAVRDWDIAAPSLVLTEAGGVLAQSTGAPFEYCGDYEKLGVIATTSAALLHELSVAVRRYAQQRAEG